MDRTPIASLWFMRAVHHALVHLYDPAELRKSPLLELFALSDGEQPASALQRILVDAIESIKPQPEVPPQSPAWRTYRILFHRYTEQCTQREVSATLALSIRQLRRQERSAVWALADDLWIRYGVQYRASVGISDSSSPTDKVATRRADTPSRKQELEWLHRSLVKEAADPVEVLRSLEKVISPLAQATRVRLEYALPQPLPFVACEPNTLRQAILNVLSPAIRAVPHGRIEITAQARAGAVIVHIRPVAGPRKPPPLPRNDVESLEMARQLATLSGGSLDLRIGAEEAQPFVAALTVPVAMRTAVLVIDDNEDTLQLIRRFLAGSPYPLVEARNAEQALTLAESLIPRAIVLDLMLPGIDGWEVLGRLREHPRLHGIPIIVCSILPQKQLALTLGAAAFLRKPISRAALLAALERWVDMRAGSPR
ncbi:MAG: hybrid sensor histidine kinase/response regulator [Anaerolineae bacterium]|nr:hybrid sensor histidine kinase/response regulator [Anaerolineae bacterium]